MKRDLVVQAAVELGLEDGQKLRVDTTVVQTDDQGIP
jgi:transposase, IS5 family